MTQQVVFQGRTGEVELKTTADATPRPKQTVQPAIDVNITWLLQHMKDRQNMKFEIDRNDKDCHTPRRNEQVDDAISNMEALINWTYRIKSYFTDNLWIVAVNHGYDLKAVNMQSIFVPVMPLFEEKTGTNPNAGVLPVDLLNPFLDEQRRCIKEKFEELERSFAGHAGVTCDSCFQNPIMGKRFKCQECPDYDVCEGCEGKIRDGSMVAPAGEVTSINQKHESSHHFAEKKRTGTLVTTAEAKLVTLALFWSEVLVLTKDSINYVEKMLYNQLIAAIGKEVQPIDFQHYLEYHNRKLFKSEYQPRPFSYAIRRPDHDPEGVLSIEADLNDGSTAQPISTTVMHSKATAPMLFPLHAAANVRFFGDRYLHGFIAHKFAGFSGFDLFLQARARQFSSFVLLLGRIQAADQFAPTHAMIIQNKDDLKVPLIFETIPTPKEFKDAIESLSPEQQRFAKAFRGMQLESTLFGVCVVQIKPQLEKLLNLPDDSLTKEIELSEDLLNMFIEYQLPSDLLSFDGLPEASRDEKIARVKALVAKMKVMIEKTRQSELDEAKQASAYRMAEKDIQASYAVDLDDGESEECDESLIELSKYEGGSGKKKGGGFGSGIFKSKGKSAPKRMMKKSMMREETMMVMDEIASSEPMKESAADKKVSQTRTTGRRRDRVNDKSAMKSNKDNGKKPPTDNKPKDDNLQGDGDVSDGEWDDSELVDYTKIPKTLESQFEKLDTDNSLRPTIIKLAESWSKKFKKSLLAKEETQNYEKTEQDEAKQKAFDLLDALTKSGSLSVDQADLHVVIAATHCFEKTLVSTIIQANVNPIEKIERSSLIIASTIHGTTVASLIKDEHAAGIRLYSPQLIVEEANSGSVVAMDE